MPETILEGPTGDTSGYVFRSRRYRDPAEVARVRSRKSRGRMTWGWIVEQDEEDTQGFLSRVRW